jgi:hypothetical protein
MRESGWAFVGGGNIASPTVIPRILRPRRGQVCITTHKAPLPPFFRRGSPCHPNHDASEQELAHLTKSYSPTFREGLFSESGFPAYRVLGNSPAYARIPVRYRGVGKRACSPGFLQEVFSETADTV